MISLAGTRLSEQPIHRYFGDCWCTSDSKKWGSSARTSAAHLRLFSKSWSSPMLPRVVACCGDDVHATDGQDLHACIEGFRPQIFVLMMRYEAPAFRTF